MFWLCLTICNFTKPNFFVEFVPVVFIYYVYKIIRKTFGKEDILSTVLIMASAPIMLLQYRKLYVDVSSSSIAFSNEPWLTFWNSPQRVPFIITGLLFPILVTIVLMARRTISRELLLTWGIWAVGMAERFFIVESGERSTHGNFMWGAFAATFLLYVVCLYELIKVRREERVNKWVALIPLIPLIMNCAAGLAYFDELLDGTYYLM